MFRRAGVWDQVPEARPGKPAPKLRKMIRDRHARARSPISPPLAPEPISKWEGAAGRLFQCGDSGLGGAAVLIATAAGCADGANNFPVHDDGNPAFRRDCSGEA